jgi:hypothetical protein
MKIFTVTALILAGLLTTSCSKRSTPDNDQKLEDSTKRSEPETSEQNRMEPSEEADADEKPDSGDIGEDCVAFLSATKVVAPIKGANATDGQCPTCPVIGEGAEVLKFDDVKIDKVALMGATCQVTVRILATFNPSHGGTIAGGLVGWIPAEQRNEYAQGKTPSGQQTYEVNITYRRDANGWQPIDFSPSH